MWKDDASDIYIYIIFSVCLYAIQLRKYSDSFTNFLLFFPFSEAFQKFADCYRYCGCLFFKHKELKCLTHRWPTILLLYHHVTFLLIVVNSFCQTVYKVKQCIKYDKWMFLVPLCIFSVQACVADRQQYFYG